MKTPTLPRAGWLLLTAISLAMAPACAVSSDDSFEESEDGLTYKVKTSEIVGSLDGTGSASVSVPAKARWRVVTFTATAATRYVFAIRSATRELAVDVLDGNGKSIYKSTANGATYEARELHFNIDAKTNATYYVAVRDTDRIAASFDVKLSGKRPTPVAQCVKDSQCGVGGRCILDRCVTPKTSTMTSPIADVVMAYQGATLHVVTAEREGSNTDAHPQRYAFYDRTPTALDSPDYIWWIDQAPSFGLGPTSPFGFDKTPKQPARLWAVASPNGHDQWVFDAFNGAGMPLVTGATTQRAATGDMMRSGPYERAAFWGCTYNPTDCSLYFGQRTAGSNFGFGTEKVLSTGVSSWASRVHLHARRDGGVEIYACTDSELLRFERSSTGWRKSTLFHRDGAHHFATMARGLDGRTHVAVTATTSTGTVTHYLVVADGGSIEQDWILDSAIRGIQVDDRGTAWLDGGSGVGTISPIGEMNGAGWVRTMAGYPTALAVRSDGSFAYGYFPSNHGPFTVTRYEW